VQAARQNRELQLLSGTAKAPSWRSRLSPTRSAAIMKRRLASEILPT